MSCSRKATDIVHRRPQNLPTENGDGDWSFGRVMPIASQKQKKGLEWYRFTVMYSRRKCCPYLQICSLENYVHLGIELCTFRNRRTFTKRICTYCSYVQLQMIKVLIYSLEKSVHIPVLLITKKKLFSKTRSEHEHMYN